MGQCGRSAKWAYFLAKLQEEIPEMAGRCSDVDPLRRPGDFAEMARWAQGVLQGRVAGGRVVRVVEIRTGGKSSRRNRDNPNQVSDLVSCDPEGDHKGGHSSLVGLVRAVSARFKEAQSDEESDRNQGAVLSRATLLSSRPVSWLLLPRGAFSFAAASPTGLPGPPGGAPPGVTGGAGKPIGSRVYFHVEGRAAALQQGHTDAVVDAITAMYGVAEPALPSVLEVTGLASRHRSTPKASKGARPDPEADGFSSYPDLLQVGEGGGVQHFAAASLEQLVECRALRGKQATLSSALYVARECRGGAGSQVDGREPLLGAVLQPLGALELKCLATAYGLESLSRGRPTADAIPPGLGPDSRYCTITAPTFSLGKSQALADSPQAPPGPLSSGPLSSGPPSALLLEVAVGPSNDSTKQQPEARQLPGKLPGKWDATLLGECCRWRSCLADATQGPPPRYLCHHHSLLKQYLDGRGKAKGGAPSEANRFLPKKPPAAAAGSGTSSDLAMIRAASSLLVELLNGKLAQTILSFCRRAATESSQVSSNSRGKPSPSWARWTSPSKLEAARDAAAKRLRHAKALRDAERSATLELGKLAELGVYPTAELALMRRQSQGQEGEAADSEGGDLSVDLEQARRKLGLLRSRREATELQLQVQDHPGMTAPPGY